MKKIDNKYKCIPFWSWNSELNEEELVNQINWMHNKGIGGFFMHARGGLTTEYLGEKWFSCIQASAKRAQELDMHAYAYDENGWPSGFAGGKLLEDKENHDLKLTYSFGAYDQKSLVAYDYSGDKLIRVTSGNDVMNIYKEYSPSTADILNPEVVDKFLQLTHEEYKNRDKFGIKGFFTDEPQYFRWGHPFTKVLFKYWEEKYNQDILDGIGLMFIEKEGYKEFRYKYWKAMQDLMINNWAKKIYNWCDSNGYKMTGHYVEETSIGYQMMCCVACMPLYEYEHIPGMDYLSRWDHNGLAEIQLGSVAAQLGKKQVLTETFACCGWDVNPLELKRIAEQQFVFGPNLMCQHLLPFKENGQRKRDYPAHFSSVNPWVEKNFEEFNDYFSVLGEQLSNSTELVNVAVLHPVTSSFFDYKRTEEKFGIGDLDSKLANFIHVMIENHIPFHFVDETILEKHGKVENNKLICGLCSYDYFILPCNKTMDKNTEELLKQYVDNGGKVLIYGEKPTYLEWNQYDYPYLNSNFTLEELKGKLDFEIDNDFNARLTYRRDKNGDNYLFIVNTDEEKDINIKLKNFKSFKSYNILKDEYEIIPSGTIHLNKNQSLILYPSNECAKIKAKPEEIELNGEFELREEADNCMTLDYLKFSKDGENYSSKMAYMGAFEMLLRERYVGDLYLKYEFNVKEIPSICSVLVEKENIESVSINGNVVELSEPVESGELHKYNIADHLVTGNNEIVVKMNYYQDPNVFFVLFDAGDTESLKNCLAYNSTIEAVYLKGNFGVYGDFKQGKDETILLGKNFYLAKQKKTISDLILDGFPFMYGDIKLRKRINLENINKEIVFKKRFHLIDLTINNGKTNRLMFDYKVDGSKDFKIGENIIDLTLTIGKRNQMGTHHSKSQEELGVGPYSWELLGTWKDGKSSMMNDDEWAFVKTII